MSYSLVKGDIVNIINDDGHFKAVIPSPHFAPCVRLSPSPPITRGNNIVWAIVLSPFRPSSDLSVRVELRSYWAMTETNCKNTGPVLQAAIRTLGYREKMFETPLTQLIKY